MATLKQRLHKKNSSGSYDVVHLETSSDLVIRPDGTTVESSLNELKTSVSNGKSAVASAITDKGISTSATAEFDTMASNIRNIPTGIDTSDATATAANILSGKTAYVNGSKIAGNMTNRGAVSKSLNCGASYTIPIGYHNGSGKVTANSLASQTVATAAVGDIAKGKTAWVSGSKLTGTADIPTFETITVSQTLYWKSYYTVDTGLKYTQACPAIVTSDLQPLWIYVYTDSTDIVLKAMATEANNGKVHTFTIKYIPNSLCGSPSYNN